jgi:hypothetical protein
MSIRRKTRKNKNYESITQVAEQAQHPDIIRQKHVHPTNGRERC